MARSDIDELNAQLVKGLESGDASMMANVYASDAKLLAPNVEPMEGGAIRDFWGQQPACCLTEAYLQSRRLVFRPL